MTSRIIKNMAKQGGLSTLDKYGKDHFRKLAKLKWLKYKHLLKKK